MIAVAIGGAVGGLFRYLITLIIAVQSFPITTLSINIAGSFLLGLINGYYVSRKKSILYITLATGFCGGFTTMSTFSLEAIQLLQESVLLGSLYIGSSIFLGIAGCVLGVFLMERMSGEGL